MTRADDGMESRRFRITAGGSSVLRCVAVATILILQVAVPVAPYEADNLGREFVLAIPPNYVEDQTDPTIGIIVGSTSRNVTSVTVSVPLRNVGFNFTLQPGAPPYDLVLPHDLARHGVTRVTNTTIVVRSDQDISVKAYNFKQFTMAIFSVFPTRDAGKEYFIALLTQPSGGVALVTAFNAPTAVEISLTASIAFRGRVYLPGEVLSCLLRPYETLQLEPLHDDIIGTRIAANTSIAVTVGSLCAYVPDGVARCDHITEQLISYDRWGRTFFLSPFIGRLSGYQYQIIAGRDDTNVWLGSHWTRLNAGEHFRGDVANQSMIAISSSKPVLVVQYSKGTSTDNQLGDPAMLLVTPWEQYVSRVEFSVPNFPGISSVYVGLVFECNASQNIELDTPKNREAPWTTEYDLITRDNRIICNRWYTVEGGVHVFKTKNIEGVGNTIFAAMVYGVGDRIGYLYNSGFSLHPITCSTTRADGPRNREVEVPCSNLRIMTCQGDRTYSEYGIITWRETQEGNTIPSDIICPFNTLRAGEPVGERTCIPHRRKNAYWGDVQLYECGDTSEPMSATDLSKIAVNDANVARVSGVLEEVTGNLTEVNVETVSAISKTLENIVAVANPSPQVTTSVVKAVGNLVGSLRDTESSSEDLAASSSSVVQSVEQQVSLTLQDFGQFTLADENMVVQAATYDASMIGSGLEFGGGMDSDAFIRLPPEIFDSIGPGVGGMQNRGAKVRFITFNGDALFRSANESQTSGHVISAAVEGVNVQGLNEPVQITFNAGNTAGANSTLNQSRCVYWDFGLRHGVGDWSSVGCTIGEVRDGMVTCSCNHLTNFAVLMDISGQHGDVKTKYHFALDLLSKIGCAVSIAALVLTIIVFIIFKRLRNSRPRRILLHFCVSLLCLYIVFLFGIDFAASIDEACVAVGAAIHYFILTTMLWMAVEALNMYLLIVRVFDEEGPCFLCKACILAWGGPLVVVGVTVGLRLDDYLHKPYCFLTPGLSFFLGVLAPIGLILAFNFIMFIVVIRRLWTVNLGGNMPLEKEDKAARYRQLRSRLLNAFSISVLLGLTWVFGFLAIEDATFVFQLVFCVVNSLQGLVVFILFCARQEDVRKSMKPHYSRLTGMLPIVGRSSNVTAYSLTSRSPSGDNDDRRIGRSPLRTAPLTTGMYTHKLTSSSTDEVRMISSSDHVSEFHD